MAPRKQKHEPCAKIIEHDRLLNGNGEKGALEKVEEHESALQTMKDIPAMVKDHEAFIQQLRGAKAAVVAILGSSLAGLFLQVYSMLKK